jgi:hypothetical protein
VHLKVLGCGNTDIIHMRNMRKTTSFIPISTITSNNYSTDNNDVITTRSKAYFNFINSIKSPASRKTYEFIIRKYMQYHNLQSIDDLLLLSEINNNKNDTITIEDQIIKWLVSLRESVSYVTRRSYMAAILTFYEINDITLRNKRIARFLGHLSY